MFNQLSDKENFSEQIYQKYLESAYLVEARYNDLLIENLTLSIEISNLGFDIKECNETC